MTPTIEREKYLLMTLLLVVIAMSPAMGHAWQIGTGFSSSCHERFTAKAAEERLADTFEIGEEVPIPADDIWRPIGDGLAVGLDAGWDEKSRAEKFLLTSLLIGSRYPDTEGQSVTNVADARNAHVSAADQYSHALRRPENDGFEGSRQTVEGTRQLIQTYVDRGQEFLNRPPAQQLIQQEIYVDFYGVTKVTVWAPAFYIGYALHTLQDSFSHSVRSEDLTQVLHVMNYIEAVRGELDEEQDGLAHSSTMDDCFDESIEQVAVASQEASSDLLEAAIGQYLDSDSEERMTVTQVLDEWLTHVEKPECTLENNLCESEWWDSANEGKTSSFAFGGCQSAPGGGSGPGTLLLAVFALGGLALRQSRRSA